MISFGLAEEALGGSRCEGSVPTREMERQQLLQHRGRRGGIEGALAKVLIEGRGVGEKGLRQRVLRGIEEDQRLLLLLRCLLDQGENGGNLGNETPGQDEHAR